MGILQQTNKRENRNNRPRRNQKTLPNKKEVKKKILRYYKENIEKQAKTKKKAAYLLQNTEEWTPEKPRQYMAKLTRIQTTHIFKARSRMLHIKNNMRGAYKENMTCRLCNKEIETQEHILSECTKLHQENKQLRTNAEEIYTEDLDTLKRTANNITQIMEEVKKTKPRKGKKEKQQTCQRKDLKN